jgi:hypothetical protein
MVSSGHTVAEGADGNNFCRLSSQEDLTPLPQHPTSGRLGAGTLGRRRMSWRPRGPVLTAAFLLFLMDFSDSVQDEISAPPSLLHQCSLASVEGRVSAVPRVSSAVPGVSSAVPGVSDLFRRARPEIPDGQGERGHTGGGPSLCSRGCADVMFEQQERPRPLALGTGPASTCSLVHKRFTNGRWTRDAKRGDRKRVDAVR